MARFARSLFQKGTWFLPLLKTHPAMLPWKDLTEDLSRKYFDIGFAIIEAFTFFDELVKDIKKTIT